MNAEPCCDEGMTCLACDPDATFADIYANGPFRPDWGERPAPLSGPEHEHLRCRRLPRRGVPRGEPMSEIRPRIDSGRWTFELVGPCVYCGKKATRTRTFYARTYQDAVNRALAAQEDMSHRKCGGY